jgi:hypothetical protein
MVFFSQKLVDFVGFVEKNDLRNFFWKISLLLGYTYMEPKLVIAGRPCLGSMFDSAKVKCCQILIGSGCVEFGSIRWQANVHRGSI